MLGHVDLLVERGEVVEDEHDGVVQLHRRAEWTSVEVILVALLVSVVVLSAAARAINVPYPIVLVVGGALLGAAAGGLPDVELDPDLVLVIFLPPLLYSARVLRQPARPAGRPAADHAAVGRARAGDDASSSRSSRTS